MPRLSSWFVRISLIYLAIGFSLGALMLANKGLAFFPPTWKLLPVHIELLLVGWFVQLAIGVAYWILPRLSGASPRGDTKLVWAAFWLINLGISLVVVHVFLPLSWLVLLGRIMQLTGVASFVVASWRRVKPFVK